MVDSYISKKVQPIEIGKGPIKPEIHPVTPFLQITPGKFRAKETKVLEATQIHSLTKPFHLVLKPHSSP